MVVRMVVTVMAIAAPEVRCVAGTLEAQLQHQGCRGGSACCDRARSVHHNELVDCQRVDGQHVDTQGERAEVWQFDGQWGAQRRAPGEGCSPSTCSPSTCPPDLPAVELRTVDLPTVDLPTVDLPIDVLAIDLLAVVPPAAIASPAASPPAAAPPAAAPLKTVRSRAPLETVRSRAHWTPSQCTMSLSTCVDTQGAKRVLKEARVLAGRCGWCVAYERVQLYHSSQVGAHCRRAVAHKP